MNSDSIAIRVTLQNNADWDCFKTPILREILTIQNPLLEGHCAFLEVSWMCKKQTSVSHSSTESKIISLDVGLRLDWIPALDLWDLIVSVRGNTTQTPERPGRPVVSPILIDPVAVGPEESGPILHRATSRVVLMSHGVPVRRLNPSPPSEDVEDSDSNRGGNSDFEDGEDEVDDPVPEVVVPIPAELSRVAINSGFRSLDSVTLETEFRTRSCLMRVIPKMMRGVFRTALRLSFQEVTQARAEGDVERETRAWKLFLLAPRMLLTRPPRGGKVSRAKLVERCAAFARGEWIHLI